VDYGHAEAQKVFGEDPRQYHLMTKSFVKDESGKVIGLNTVNLNFKDGQLIEQIGSEKRWDTQLRLAGWWFLQVTLVSFTDKTDRLQTPQL
jgi:glutamate synthase (NADPH/NADH) small chain